MPKIPKWLGTLLIIFHCLSLAYFIYNYLHMPAFPQTLVINLDSRPDKWQQTQAELANWPVTPQRISAVKYDPGWKGCTLSHIKCLTLADQRKVPWVLILEDDCELTPRALQRFTALLTYLWHHKRRWDIFSGGMTSVSDVKVVNSHLSVYQAKGLTTHFCLIHRDAYKKILKDIPKTPQTMKDPIDLWYSKHMRIWTTTPFLAVQRPTQSDIENKNTDYTALFDSAESALTSQI